jgi:ribose transport system substrate-binding protein
MTPRPSKMPPKTTRETDRYLVPIVAKTIDLLDCFQTDAESLTLKQITQKTGLSHTTAYRILHTLVTRDYLSQSGHLYRINKTRRRMKFGFANLSKEISLAVGIQHSLEKAAGSSGIDLVVWDNERNADRAVKNAEEIVEQHVDLAIEFQLFEHVAPVIADIFSRAHIPLISIVNPHHGSLYVGVDNFRAGLSAGIALAEYATKHWRGQPDAVLLLESPPAGRTVQSRLVGALRGLESRLGELSKLVQHLDSGGNKEASKAAVLKFLKKSKAKRVLIAGINDETAIGAYNAVAESNFAKQFAIVGHGGSPEMCEIVADPLSPCVGTVSFHPEMYGPELVTFGLSILRGRSSSPTRYIPHGFLGKDWLASREKAG